MNYAIVLSGGIGSRMTGTAVPKQYIEVNGKPIIVFTLEKLSSNVNIDKIVIVAAEIWQPKIKEWIRQQAFRKEFSFACSGDSRQESVYNGLKKCAESGVNEEDNVLIHDAVRPLLSNSLIDKCIKALEFHDGVMPGLPVNDTIYCSEDRNSITNLVNRDILFAGQSPEAYKLNAYLKINANLSKQEFEKVRGSSEIAFRNGFSIKLIEGEYINFKITTAMDLKIFEQFIEGGK